MKPKLSKSFSCVKTIDSVYDGGQVEWHDEYAIAFFQGALNIVKEGEVKATLKEEEDNIVKFTLGNCENVITIVTAHKSGLVRIWNCSDIENPAVTRTFRSIHTGFISVMKIHTLTGSHSGCILATGGSEGTVKVWDITNQYFTHNL